jgi:hypothetical protein
MEIKMKKGGKKEKKRKKRVGEKKENDLGETYKLYEDKVPSHKFLKCFRLLLVITAWRY